eukprot:9977434-Alexandrium_andersonii.AAC.1
MHHGQLARHANTCELTAHSWLHSFIARFALHGLPVARGSSLNTQHTVHSAQLTPHWATGET